MMRGVLCKNRSVSELSGKQDLMAFPSKSKVRYERKADMREHGLCMKVNADKYHLPKGDHQQ